MRRGERLVTCLARQNVKHAALQVVQRAPHAGHLLAAAVRWYEQGEQWQAAARAAHLLAIMLDHVGADAARDAAAECCVQLEARFACGPHQQHYAYMQPLLQTV